MQRCCKGDVGMAAQPHEWAKATELLTRERRESASLMP